MSRRFVSGRHDLESANCLARPLLTDDDLKSPPNSEDGSMAVETEFIQPASARQRACWISASVVLAVIALIELAVAVPLFFNTAATWEIPGLTSYPRFFVIGDWGRDGDFNQTVVADAMARKARSFQPDFVVSTGDNFYESGLVSADDPGFDTSFRDVYNHDELINVPWHVALGNHDYGEVKDPKETPKHCSRSLLDNDECFYGPAHQLDVRLTQRDPRWHCERFFSLKLAAGDVEIFFIDTTPILRSYVDEVWAINRGGVLEQSPEDQLRELEARLSASTATWKLVVGHHPIRTNHNSAHLFKDMVADVEPMLMEYGVQAYFAGHDHNLQHLHNPERGYHHITSGAGSSIGHHFFGQEDSPFQWAGNGFVAVSMGRKSMKVEYIGVEGDDDPLFSIEIPKDVYDVAARK